MSSPLSQRMRANVTARKLANWPICGGDRIENENEYTDNLATNCKLPAALTRTELSTFFFKEVAVAASQTRHLVANQTKERRS